MTDDTLGIEPGPALNIYVNDLGEDGDNWIVEGTDDQHIAGRVILRHLAAQVGEEDQQYLDAVAGMPTAQMECRTDFWWAGDPDTDDHLYLCYGEDSADNPRPESTPLFTGVRVSL